MPDNPQTNGWRPGQAAVIDRSRLVTINRVTKTGRAIVGTSTFDAYGHEILAGGGMRRAKLELLTDEIKAEMALQERSLQASRAAHAAVDAAEKWLRATFSVFRAGPTQLSDVERAEHLTAAIQVTMEPTNEPY
jgi:hypothetical protein